MTYNEFKMCCIMFTITFEGKKYGDVIKNCYTVDHTQIISIVDVVFTSNNRFGYTKDSCMLFAFTNRIGLLIYTESIQNCEYYTVKEFLEHFNITSEDII